LKIAALLDTTSQAVLQEQALQMRGHAIHHLRNGRLLLLALQREPFDLILLDRACSGRAAEDIVQWVRRALGRDIGIIVMGDCEDDGEIAGYYASGTDLYLHRACGPSELAARVETLGRLAAPRTHDPCDLTCGPFRFATAERRVWVSDREVTLAPKEFDLAVLLFRNLGSLVSRQAMIEDVWRREMDPASRTVDSHLSRIRTKLGLWPHNGVRLCAIYMLGSRLDPT
jgi:DNA-binding response OmpR family regulator